MTTEYESTAACKIKTLADHVNMLTAVQRTFIKNITMPFFFGFTHELCHLDDGVRKSATAGTQFKYSVIL